MDKKNTTMKKGPAKNEISEIKLINFPAIEKKWQDRWEKEKVFEANPNKKEKFFVNFPYPYINAYLHLGHAFSSTRVDITARYKRMRGYNVLFPQAWHCTGTPVWAASQRIREKEETQIKIMKSQGFSDSEIPKFGDPKHWVDVFVPAAKIDFTRMGASVDWRRNFITTDMNPFYDKFIAWQFRKLKEKGYVVQGKHPVVWCPKDNMPIGDHDRVEGEGETPQEFSLLKFKFEDSYLIAATLRPETVFGETNFWVNPLVEYVKAEVNNEKWIVSQECIEKLKNQDKEIKIIGKVSGKSMIGKYCRAPLINKDLIILPAEFSDPKIGTGLVTSVPSDAPYDYIALKDLQNNEAEMKKYNLNPVEVRKIKPIPIIESKEWGEQPAVKIVEQMKIKNQTDPKLEEATQIIYKAGFYAGKMNSNCKEFAGLSVTEAKEKMKKEMKEKGLLDIFYELSGKIVCRCLTPCVAKIVSNQWFLKYGDENWKKITHKALDNLKLFPETIRPQFSYVIDWLNDWACTHHHGAGTKLPWDNQWVIESLSDSTIYMAYYTIAHKIEKIDLKEIDDNFFDYIFLGLGKGNKEWLELKKEFEYWYPFDIRSTAKDLVQNHMSFCLFNHTAIFPEKYWPKGFSVNGWLLVNGEKMSKSKGNFFTIREMLNKYPADVVRTSLILGGEAMDDPNFDFTNAESFKKKLQQFYNLTLEKYKKIEKTDKVEITEEDSIFIKEFNSYLKQGTEAMDSLLFRTAFVNLFYQMQKILKDYCNKDKINQKILNEFIEKQIKILSPFCPHFAEELAEQIGMNVNDKDFISIAEWPEAYETKLKIKIEISLEDKIIEHITQILAKLENKQKINKIYAYVLPFEITKLNKEKIIKAFDKELTIFAVNDPKKFDPNNMSKRALPGRPGIYIE